MSLLPDVRTWAEWGQVFTSVAQWEAAVREICRRERIPVEHVEAGYPGTNAVFVVDDAYVVKIYAPFCHEDFDLERRLHTALAGHPRLPVPCLIAEGVLDDRIRWPYIVVNFLPGEPIREVRDQLSPADRVRIAARMGEIVRQLHNTPPDVLMSPELARVQWRQYVAQRRADVCVPQPWKGILPESVVLEIYGFLASVDLVGDNAPLLLLNGDLTEDHVLLQQHGDKWRISGLIDFGDALVGPRDYEWPALWFSALDADFNCLTAFMRSYDPGLKLDDDFYRTAMAFTFVHEFGTDIIAWILERMGRPHISSLQELQALLWER